jgi:hypothetical protein
MYMTQMPVEHPDAAFQHWPWHFQDPELVVVGMRKSVRQIASLEKKSVSLATKIVVTLRERCLGSGREGDEQVIVGATAQVPLRPVVANGP